MNCPYKDKESPPCNVIEHPQKENIFFCKVCQESYDVREIGQESSGNPLLLILGIMLVIIGIKVTFSEPVTPTHSQGNSANQVDN